MANDVLIRIKATDDASTVLKKVGTAGKQMGTDVAQGAEKGGRSFDDLNKRAAALGAAFTAGAAILGQWSRSAQDAAAIQRQLEASIAATGASFDEYAAQIEEVGKRAVQLGQDDEAASQAISALTQITGSASVAISEMGLVFDLAAAKSLSLESAAELVGKVHEGNTGILQRYGIVVEENATAEEALAAIQQQVAGQAEAHATSYARLREELSNVTDAIGGAVGEFAPLLALLPGVSSGFTLLGGAIGAVAPNLTKAGAATAALNLAMGPVGLVLAAGAAAAAVGVLAYRLGSDYGDAVRDAEKATSALVDTINRLLSAGDATGLVGQELRATFVSIGAATADLGSAIDALEDAMRHTQIQENLTGPDVQPQLDAMQASLDQLKAIEEQFGSTKAAADEYKETTAALNAVLAHTGPGQEEILRQAQLLSDQLKKDGIAGLKAYEDGMQELAGSMAEYDAAAVKAAASTGNYWKVFSRLVSVGEDWSNLEVVTFLEAVTRTTDAAAFSLGNMAKQAAAGSDAMTDLSALKYDSIYQTQLLTAANDDNAFSLNNLFQASLDTGQAMTAQAQAQKEAAAASLAWRVEATEGASTLGTMAERASAGDAAMGGLTGSIRDVTTAAQRMALGIGSAGDALATFKGIQDGIIESQDVYSHQLSEYNSQLGYIEDAEKLLNERRAEGQELTQEELGFLDDAGAAQKRLQGGVEDATIALGMQAAQYGENMSTGDRLNQTLGGLDGTLQGLSGTVETLTRVLLELGNTHPEPSVALSGADAALGQALAIATALDAIQGVYSATVNVGVNDPNNIGGLAGLFADGGTVAYADGGTVKPIDRFAAGGFSYGNWALVGERGPELVNLPGGAQVTHSEATKSRLGHATLRGAGAITVHNLYLYPASSDVEGAIRSRVMAGR